MDTVSPELIEHIARQRAGGSTWNFVALDSKKPYEPTEDDMLRGLVSSDPDYEKALRNAQRELFGDALAEAVLVLRQLVRNERDLAHAGRFAKGTARRSRPGGKSERHTYARRPPVTPRTRRRR